MKPSITPLLAATLLSLILPAKADLGGTESSAVPNAGEAVAEYQSPKWRLAFADEFNKEGLPDPGKWTQEHGMLRNREAQFYTSGRLENAQVQGGNLTITGIKEPWEKAAYTAASITTQNHFAFTYGKVEIRAKIPKGRGVWPALWFVGADKKAAGWPKCGEIDLMEYVGFRPDLLHFTVHTAKFNHMQKTQKGTKVSLPEPWTDFHRYGLLWTPQRLVWFLDDRPVFSFANSGKGPEEWPFDTPQYLIINLAIGGNWGGQQGIDESAFPAKFVIDYARIWQAPPETR